MSVPLTWWGHASATVEPGGARVLLDPVLDDRLHHLRRRTPTPGPEAHVADLVLVSHLHSDHFHVPSLQRLSTGAVVLVPDGGQALLRDGRRRGALPGCEVRGVRPGDVVEVTTAAGVEVRVRVLRADHDGRRLPLRGAAAGPAIGFVVEAGGQRVWFPGDTGWSERLVRDLEALDPVDLALPPIGGWGPSLDVVHHLGPVEAARALALLGADAAVPVHWGTFWPVGLQPLAPGVFRRFFTTPGARFLDAVDEHAPTTRAVLARPGVRLVP
ncbi:MBL fold metallo-hydrolase [Nocardioides bruguierae]|uniref:MBL fold metallo-hydrolase n=1 Tax=Nocardioides bruguierae TaxID=2945102 RepID=UPI0020214D09|nr:MBL fold metallo-hydrolase [Nocardioides bruguierae]MCL8023888.1 MBL fold metallo-hydrolase [Nocardioides bruguierae]